MESTSQRKERWREGAREEETAASALGQPLKCAAELVLFCVVVLVVAVLVVLEGGAGIKEKKSGEMEAEEEERAGREGKGSGAQEEREAARGEETGPRFLKKRLLASLTTRQVEKIWTKES